MARCLAVAITAMLPCAVAPNARAHEIPADVKINAFVRPAGDRLELLIWVLLAAMREVDFPTRGPGYLDLARIDEALRNAVKLWLIDNIDVYENDVRLPPPRIVYARVSLASDRSFASYEQARAHVQGPPLADDLELYWNQQLLDVLLEYPIKSDRSEFAIHPRVDRIGLQGFHRAALPAAGRRHARVRVPRRPGPGAARSALAPRGAAFRGVRLLAHPRRRRPPAVPALLVIPFRRLRPLVIIVTSFTVGHSISLVASASASCRTRSGFRRWSRR